MTTNDGIAIRRETHHCLNMHDRKPVRFQARIALVCGMLLTLSGCIVADALTIGLLIDDLETSRPASTSADPATLSDFDICVHATIRHGDDIAWRKTPQYGGLKLEAKSRGLTVAKCRELGV